jgi:hypothetical protein
VAGWAAGKKVTARVQASWEPMALSLRGSPITWIASALAAARRERSLS